MECLRFCSGIRTVDTGVLHAVVRSTFLSLHDFYIDITKIPRWLRKSRLIISTFLFPIPLLAVFPDLFEKHVADIFGCYQA